MIMNIFLRKSPLARNLTNLNKSYKSFCLIRIDRNFWGHESFGNLYDNLFLKENFWSEKYCF